MAYLCNKDNVDKWDKTRKPGARQRRRMVALAVMEGVRACMSHHVYCVVCRGQDLLATERRINRVRAHRSSE